MELIELMKRLTGELCGTANQIQIQFNSILWEWMELIELDWFVFGAAQAYAEWKNYEIDEVKWNQLINSWMKHEARQQRYLFWLVQLSWFIGGLWAAQPHGNKPIKRRANQRKPMKLKNEIVSELSAMEWKQTLSLCSMKNEIEWREECRAMEWRKRTPPQGAQRPAASQRSKQNNSSFLGCGWKSQRNEWIVFADAEFDWVGLWPSCSNHSFHSWFALLWASLLSFLSSPLSSLLFSSQKKRRRRRAAQGRREKKSKWPPTPHALACLFFSLGAQPKEKKKRTPAKNNLTFSFSMILYLFLFRCNKPTYRYYLH